MKIKALRKEARGYFLPVFLGSNKISHSLSAKIFFRFGIESLILSTKASPRDLVDISSTRLPLVNSNSARLLCEQLSDISERSDGRLLLLVPCTEQYKVFINDNRSFLEEMFIIRMPEELISTSPLADIPQKADEGR